MDKRELSSLVKLREAKDSVVVSIRIRSRVMDKLKAKGVDVSATVRSVLERLAD